MDKSKIRLSKAMAAAGVASRRASEELIFAGKVTVNGSPALLPQTMVDPKLDEIVVDGVPLQEKERKVYYILNKPVGYLCTNKSYGSTSLVIDLFKDEGYRLFTVGRLDKDTEGLILVTNDGHFANSVIHPSANIHKEYIAKVDAEISHEHLVAISNGTLVEGSFVKPLKVEKVRRGTLKVVIGEGKKREARLLLQNAGLKTLELKRVRLGGLRLGNLKPGEWRVLSDKEKKSLFN